MTGNVQKSKDDGNRLPESQNPYEFSDEEKQDFGNFSMDTAIARAWSRARKAGKNVGSPTVDEIDRETMVGQQFQYGYAVFNKNDNPNLMVQFYDARGLIIEESGL